MTCIICRTEKPPSPEHVIPRALGGSFVIHRVCQDCNNARLSQVDKGLVEHHASVERRVALQLEGNRGTVPDPVAEAIRRPIPTDIPNVNVRLSRETEGYRARVERHVEVALVEQPDGHTRIDIDLVVDENDGDNAEMYLRSALRKAGIRDEDRLAAICAETLPRLELRHGPATIGVPVKKNEGGHHLGITKIAYEMAHHWLGDAWLDDPIAVTMRRALGGDKTAGGQFKIGDGSSIERPRITRDPSVPFEQLALGYEPERTHLLTLYPIANKLFVCVWLLDAFCGMMLVTDDAAQYEQPEFSGIGMDVVLRRYEEFQTIIPAGMGPA